MLKLVIPVLSPLRMEMPQWYRMVRGLEKYTFKSFGLSWEAFFTNAHMLQGFGVHYVLLLNLVLTPITAPGYCIVTVGFCFCFCQVCQYGRPNGT